MIQEEIFEIQLDLSDLQITDIQLCPVNMLKRITNLNFSLGT